MNGGHGLLFLGLFILALGGGCAFWFTRQNNAHKAQADASRAWPAAPGRVVATEVQVKKAPGGSRRQNEYKPLVAYDFAVGDQNYRGTRIRYGYLGFNFESQAAKVLAPYAVGTPVQVHYNPANPADSVLEAGAMTSNLKIGIYICYFTIALGLLVTLGSLR